ncbi:hypothetical protein EVAR_53651_1 [Eumeta japonica]|uniref:Uncharacterized protein n=1 Tax=Eumeta variegata TaxID=151549 RepID=A0A4C1YJK7_EUMVA|nr:hypothetical protein EVAR_53651_1 [Eumeta japonica]
MREIQNKGLKVQPDSISDFRNLTNLLATMKAAYHTYSLRKSASSVLSQAYQRVSARRVSGDHGTAACTETKKQTARPPVSFVTSGHTANYLDARAPQKYPTPSRNNRDNNSHPNDKAARTDARASGLKNATYANVTAGRRKDPPKPKAMCLRTH